MFVGNEPLERGSDGFEVSRKYKKERLINDVRYQDRE